MGELWLKIKWHLYPGHGGLVKCDLHACLKMIDWANALRSSTSHVDRHGTAVCRSITCSYR